jgi:hypothetical protein
VLGHVCPECRKPWALTAVRGSSGFLVVCRHCTYRQPVTVPQQSGPPAVEMIGD